MVTSQQLLAANIIFSLVVVGTMAYAIRKILTRKKKRKALPLALKEKVMERCNNECYRCGLDKCLEIHHLDGDHTNNDSRNLLVLCSDCHKKIPRRYKKK